MLTVTSEPSFQDLIKPSHERYETKKIGKYVDVKSSYSKNIKFAPDHIGCQFNLLFTCIKISFFFVLIVHNVHTKTISLRKIFYDFFLKREA